MLACCLVTLEDFIALTLLSEVSVGWRKNATFLHLCLP